MKKILKNYGFVLTMLLGVIGGCVVGAIFPVVKDAAGDVVSRGATVLEPLGTVFINLMFCIVVPMVFCSIASAIANMGSAKKAGKVMGVTVVTFCATAAIAALIMYIIARVFPWSRASTKWSKALWARLWAWRIWSSTSSPSPTSMSC